MACKNMRPIRIRKEVPLFILGLLVFNHYVPMKTYTGGVSAVERRTYEIAGCTGPKPASLDAK